MMNRDKSLRILRRTFLAGAGTTAAAALLRPLLASAATGADPKRLLIVHRPCGTRLERWFPQTGGVKDFEITPLLQSFAKLKDEMVVFSQLSCPRSLDWLGDQHGSGMITMMSGRRPMVMPGTSYTGDPNAKNFVSDGPSFDQELLSKLPLLQGTSVPSVQLTACRASSAGLPIFRVMSYSARAAPMFPEARPDVAFANIFGPLVPTAPQDPAALARLRQQDKSVLDYLQSDLNRLKAQTPSAQRPKLESHLAAIAGLEKDLANMAGGDTKACLAKPMLADLPAPTGDLSMDDAQHDLASRQQLQIIKAAFQCDLTRMATFSFAHGNSYIRFAKVVPGLTTDGAGHHDISHEGGATALDAQAAIDKYYSDRLADLLTDMKATPEGTGNMLDNTLVVYFNEVSIGADHNAFNMPVLMFGAKNLGLNRGSHLHLNGRYMTDVWTSAAKAFGDATMERFGDPAWGQGPIADLFV